MSRFWSSRTGAARGARPGFDDVASRFGADRSSRRRSGATIDARDIFSCVAGVAPSVNRTWVQVPADGLPNASTADENKTLYGHGVAGAETLVAGCAVSVTP